MSAYGVKSLERSLRYANIRFERNCPRIDAERHNGRLPELHRDYESGQNATRIHVIVRQFDYCRRQCEFWL